MIRGLIFKFFFYTGTIVVCTIFIPALILPQKISLIGGKILGHWIKFCLYFFLSVKIKIKGIENIPENTPFFIASLHQSLFETFFLQTIFNSPVFILKRELILIPIFGWYLKKIGSISIKRNKVTKDNLSFFDDINKTLSNSKRPLIIFPQGTRVKPEERPPFKKGVARIYEELKISCQPVAINSGYVWPKKGSKTSNKQITISILPSIDYQMEKNEFVNNLEKKIYSELDRIN